MANTDGAFGLKPKRYLSGAPYNGSCQRFFIPSTDGTAAYIGGLVKLAGSADADGHYATVTANVSAADVVVGVIVGFDPVSGVTTPNLDITYRPASTAQYVWVATDPNLVFEVQEDSDGGALAVTDVGLNANLVGFTSGSTTTGLSSIEIDSSSANTTSTLDVQLIGYSPRVNNEVGNQAKWLVRLNNHQYVDGTTGL